MDCVWLFRTWSYMCDGMIRIFGEDDGVYTPRWIGGNIIEVDTLLTMLSDR